MFQELRVESQNHPLKIANTDIHIRYKFPGDTGNAAKWWRFHAIPTKALRRPKEQLPTASLWQCRQTEDGFRFSVICADFDTLPLGFNSYENLFFYLGLNFENVARSPSGKCKVFFLVRHEGFMTKGLACEFLKETLGEDLYQGVDTCLAGLSLVFLNESTYEALKVAVAGNFFDLSVLESPLEGGEYNIVQSNVSTFKYKTLCESTPTPEFARFPSGRSDPTRKAFMRIILATWNLANENGFNLSTKVLGEQLGISPARVSQLIQELINVNLLECIDSTYEIGKKAKTYRAKWILKTYLEKQKKTYNPQETTTYDPIQGEIYQWALRNISSTSLENLLTRLPGSGRKLQERRSLVIRMKKCYDKKKRA